MELRYYVKDDGTKELQYAEQIAENSWQWKPLPVDYASPLAEYNEAAEVKINRQDIETEITQIGGKEILRLRHLPSGAKIEKCSIKMTWTDREIAFRELISKISSTTNH